MIFQIVYSILKPTINTATLYAQITFRKVWRDTNFAQVGSECTQGQVYTLNIYVYTKGFTWSPRFLKTGTRSAATWPLRPQWYRPAVSFRHLRLTQLPREEKFGAHVKNVIFQFFKSWFISSPKCVPWKCAKSVSDYNGEHLRHKPYAHCMLACRSTNAWESFLNTLLFKMPHTKTPSPYPKFLKLVHYMNTKRQESTNVTRIQEPPWAGMS